MHSGAIIQTLTLRFTGYLTLGNLANLSKHYVPCIFPWHNETAFHIGLFEGKTIKINI